MHALKLSFIFGKYAGKPVEVTDTTHEIRSARLGTYTTVQPRLTTENQPILEEIRKTAKLHGLTVRFALGGFVTPASPYRDNRVTIDIIKVAEKDYRITGPFHLG